MVARGSIVTRTLSKGEKPWRVFAHSLWRVARLLEADNAALNPFSGAYLAVESGNERDRLNILRFIW
jgi:hypothetical protein